jgi:hypothetical protein
LSRPELDVNNLQSDLKGSKGEYAEFWDMYTAAHAEVSAYVEPHCVPNESHLFIIKYALLPENPNYCRFYHALEERFASSSSMTVEVLEALDLTLCAMDDIFLGII